MVENFFSKYYKKVKPLLYLILAQASYFISNYLAAIFLNYFYDDKSYGELGVQLSYSAFLQTIALFGWQNYSDQASKKHHNSALFIIECSLIGIVVSILILIFKNSIFTTFQISPWIVVHSYIILLLGIVKLQLTFKKNFKTYAWIMIASSVLTLAITVISSLLYKDVLSRITSIIAGEGIILVCYLFWIRSDFKFMKTSGYSLFSDLKAKLNFITPIILHSMIMFFYSHYGKIYIAENISYSGSGKYWFFTQLSLPILILGELFVRYNISDLYSIKDKKKHNNALKTLNYSSFVFYFTSFLVLYISNLFMSILFIQLSNVLYIIINAIILGVEKTKTILLTSSFVVTIQLLGLSFFEFDRVEYFANFMLIIGILRVILYQVNLKIQLSR